jgi:hypothetical protein
MVFGHVFSAIFVFTASKENASSIYYWRLFQRIFAKVVYAFKQRVHFHYAVFHLLLVQALL